MKKKKGKIFLSFTGVVFLIIGILLFFQLKSLTQEANSIIFHKIPFHHISDGSYVGEYQFKKLVSAKVQVQVEKNKITKITLLDYSHGPGKGAEALPQNIIEKQSLEIDNISGATVSSVVVKKAVERALTLEK